MQSLQENHHFSFQVHVVLKTLVSLMGRLKPCNARIAAERDRQTGHTQTKYCNPRCAFTLRVNEEETYGDDKDWQQISSTLTFSSLSYNPYIVA